VGDTVYAIDAFPNDDFLWRIEWIGGSVTGGAPLLFSVSSKLTQETPVAGPHPLLDYPALILKPKNVEEVPDDALSVRTYRSCRRVRELTDESSFDLRLASNVITLGDNNAATDGALLKRRANGLEIIGEAGVVRLETIRAMKTKRIGIEVRIGCDLIFTRNNQFARSFETTHEFVACHEQNSFLFASQIAGTQAF
jgi:hypothetical protein